MLSTCHLACHVKSLVNVYAAIYLPFILCIPLNCFIYFLPITVSFHECICGFLRFALSALCYFSLVLYCFNVCRTRLCGASITSSGFLAKCLATCDTHWDFCYEQDALMVGEKHDGSVFRKILEIFFECAFCAIDPPLGGGVCKRETCCRPEMRIYQLTDAWYY